MPPNKPNQTFRTWGKKNLSVRVLHWGAGPWHTIEHNGQPKQVRDGMRLKYQSCNLVVGLNITVDIVKGQAIVRYGYDTFYGGTRYKSALTTKTPTTALKELATQTQVRVSKSTLRGLNIKDAVPVFSLEIQAQIALIREYEQANEAAPVQAAAAAEMTVTMLGSASLEFSNSLSPLKSFEYPSPDLESAATGGEKMTLHALFNPKIEQTSVSTTPSLANSAMDGPATAIERSLGTLLRHTNSLGYPSQYHHNASAAMSPSAQGLLDSSIQNNYQLFVPPSPPSAVDEPVKRGLKRGSSIYTSAVASAPLKYHKAAHPRNAQYKGSWKE